MTKPILCVLLSFAALGLAPVTGVAQQKDRKVSQRHLPLPEARYFGAAEFTCENLTGPFVMADFLAHYFPVAQYGELRLAQEVQSPQGRHYTFRQYVANRPVYKSELKLNVSFKGDVLSMVAGLHPLPRKKDTGYIKSKETIAAQHLQNLLGEQAKLAQYSIEETMYVANSALEPGIVLTYGSRNTSIGSKEILLDAKGRTIDEYNLITNYKHTHSHGHVQGAAKSLAPASPAAAVRDTAIAALVYRQSPAAVAPKISAPAATKPTDYLRALNAGRQKVELLAGFRSDTFLLQSPYCVIKEFDPPTRPVQYSLTPTFNFQLGDEGFEQVNILYHISTWQQYMQSLGFQNMANFQLEVDANGWNGQDQSSYSSFTNTLSFGTGGVEDGQDPQVIIHEYSHVVSRSACATPAVGYERKVLEEANADYFAVSYKISVDSTDWHRIFTWDGHNEFWPGRMAISNKSYPKDLKGDIYEDAAIWTATLMQIQQRIGRELTDKLLLQSLYSYSSYLDLPSAARLLLQADSLLTGGENVAIMTRLFTERGILASPATLPDQQFQAGPRATSTDQLTTYYTSSPTPFSALHTPIVTVTDLSGRVLHTGAAASDELLSSLALPNGMYMVQVTSANHTSTPRLVVL